MSPSCVVTLNCSPPINPPTRGSRSYSPRAPSFYLIHSFPMLFIRNDDSFLSFLMYHPYIYFFSFLFSSLTDSIGEKREVKVRDFEGRVSRDE